MVRGPLTVSLSFGSGSCVIAWSGLIPFGDKAETLKKHFFIRDITPAKAKDQIWIEAYPRTSRAYCDNFQLICRAKDMMPLAFKIIEPNKMNSVAYQFYDIKVNDPKSPGDDPFQPPTPKGWQKSVDESLLRQPSN